MLAKIKSAALWIYNWVTVLAASLVGVPAILLELLNSLGAIDLTPLLGAPMALKIVTSVGLAKALLAFIVAKLQAKA